MRPKARVLAIVFLAVLVLDFLTLENRVVTTNVAAQRAGRWILYVALAGLMCSMAWLIADRLRKRESGAPAVGGTRETLTLGEPAMPEARPKSAPRHRSRLRTVKALLGMMLLTAWLVGAPIYAHRYVAGTPDYQPGPWVAEAFLSVFVVAQQCAAPTPMAAAFWPSMFIGVYLVFSRRDRPVFDGFLAAATAGLLYALWFMLRPR